MKRFFLTLLASSLLLTAGAQTLLPVRDSIGKLSISVDPRMELLGAVQVIAGYPLSTRDTPYSDRVQVYFGAFANSEAAKWTNKLLHRNGFSYDAPATLMLCYSFPPELKQRLSFSEYLAGRAGGEKNLRRYGDALNRFAEESRFGDFWVENKTFYRQILDRFIHTVVCDVDVVGLLEAYYNMTQKSYDIMLCPLFGDSNYGLRMPDPDGGLSTYALIAVYQAEDGTMSLNSDRLLELLFHEFSHSFVNPSTARYADLVAQSSDRFEPVREIMSDHAYGKWDICVNEHIVRAVEIRLAEALHGPEAVEKRFREEEYRGFGYIRPLVAKLREYEAQRDAAGISFVDYMPELLKVFGEAELYVPCFPGPVNAVFAAENLVYVYPTVGDAAPEVAEYVRNIADWINSRSRENNPLRLVADSVAVKMPLDSCNIVCYGTVESNLLLTKYRSKLPFQVEPGAIVADRRYDDPEIGLITCLPNPENPELGMAVYTATNDRNVININNVFHGPDDFCIFTDRDHILSRGYFEKRGSEWRFPQPRPSAD